MIRLACPGCGAKYKVGGERAGKSTRCKRCRTKFLVPAAEPPPAPPLPPRDFELMSPHTVAVPFDPLGGRPIPSLLAPEPAKPPVVHDEWATPPKGTPRPPEPGSAKPQGIDIAPCPGCRAQLTVPSEDLGSNVQCPHCHTIFAAVKPGAIVAPDAEVVSPKWEPPPPWEEPAPRPARRVRAKVGGRRTVASIGVLSAAKMAGAMSFVSGLLVSLVYGFFTLIFFLIGSSALGDSRVLGIGVLYMVCSLILVPFVYGVAGFLGGAVWALIYNLLATMIGGVEIDLE